MSVCVAIPAYNAGRTLPRALDSVLGQTCPPAEIVVVDDGSIDETAEVLTAYRPRIRYVPVPHRGLPAAARNRGIAETRSEYIAFLDADDWWYPRHLERAVGQMTGRPDVGLCYGDFQMVDEYGRVLRRIRTPNVRAQGWRALMNYDFICTSSTVVRRSSLERVGGFSESGEIVGCEDWELWLRISRRYSLARVGEPLIAYRVNARDASLGSGDRWLASFDVLSGSILEQTTGTDRAAVAAWHHYIRARWHLARGQLDAARVWMDRSLVESRSPDRRWLVWLLTRGTWSLGLPDAVRRRLGVAAARSRAS